MRKLTLCFLPRTTHSLCACLAFAALFAGALHAQVPNTPAGRQFSAWLNSFNTGDRATMLKFFEQNDLGRLIDQSVAIYNASGGYEVRKVDESSDGRVVVLAQERGPAKQFARITVSVAATEPYRMTGILIQPAQPPPDLAPPKMTAAETEAARAGTPFHQFSAWLDAFNSGDRTRIADFLTANFPSMNVDAQMNFRERTGGFELRALEQATATTLTGLVQERDSDQFGRFTLVVDPAEPHKITRFGVNAIPRPADFPSRT